jgi:hypothetical protein
VNDERVDDLESGRGGAVRRGMLRGAALGIAAVALGRFGGELAAKPKKKKKSLCKSCPKLCETADIVTCKPVVNQEVCACARTTTGESTCVGFTSGNIGCQATDQCQTDADCPANNACIKVDDVNCCTPGMTGNLCKPICKPGK